MRRASRTLNKHSDGSLFGFHSMRNAPWRAPQLGSPAALRMAATGWLPSRRDTSSQALFPSVPPACFQAFFWAFRLDKMNGPSVPSRRSAGVSFENRDCRLLRTVSPVHICPPEVCPSAPALFRGALGRRRRALSFRPSHFIGAFHRRSPEESLTMRQSFVRMCLLASAVTLVSAGADAQHRKPKPQQTAPKASGDRARRRRPSRAPRARRPRRWTTLLRPPPGK